MRARSLVVRYAAGLAFAYLLTAAEVVAIVISVSRETVIEAQSVLSATNLIATVAIVIVGAVTVWLSGVAMVARASPGQRRHDHTPEAAEHHKAAVRHPAGAVGPCSRRDDSAELRRWHPSADPYRFGDRVRSDGDRMHWFSVHATGASLVDGRRHSGFRACRAGTGSTGSTDTDVDDVFRAPGCGHRRARDAASQRLDHPARRADRNSGAGARTRRGGSRPARDDPGVVVDFGSGTRSRRRDGGSRARTPRARDRCV